MLCTVCTGMLKLRSVIRSNASSSGSSVSKHTTNSTAYAKTISTGTISAYGVLSSHDLSSLQHDVLGMKYAATA